MTIVTLVKTYKKTLLAIIALILIENIAWIIEPTVFGNVIDAFIDRSYHRSLHFQEHHMHMLFLWILLYGVNSFSGSIRRKIEPKVYQNMNTDITTNIARKDLKLWRNKFWVSKICFADNFHICTLYRY